MDNEKSPKWGEPGYEDFVRALNAESDARLAAGLADGTLCGRRVPGARHLVCHLGKGHDGGCLLTRDPAVRLPPIPRNCDLAWD